MSRCGYYSCFKGVPKCNNPAKPDCWKEWASKDLARRCMRCRRGCGGIWPSQLEKVLDMIESQYLDFCCNYHAKSGVFQMPKDDEVKA